eukprot:3130387-Prorocentrum_lima.AAC.1
MEALKAIDDRRDSLGAKLLGPSGGEAADFDASLKAEREQAMIVWREADAKATSARTAWLQLVELQAEMFGI